MKDLFTRQSAGASALLPLCPSLFMALVLFWTALCVAPTNLAAQEAQANTLFLPLKIHSSTAQERFTTIGDQLLTKVLRATTVRRQNFHLPTRAAAQATFNYQADWPPPPMALKKAATGPERYIAAGSMTKLGKKISLDVKVFDLQALETPAYYVFLEAKDMADLEKTMDQLLNELLAYTSREYLITAIKPAGNARIDSGAILHQVTSQAGDIYDKEILNKDLKNIFKMGYFNDVKIKVVDTAKGKEITFEVTEKAVIGQVTINGAKKLKDKAIQEVIGVVPNTIINLKKVKEDVANIRALYKEKGFYNTEVSYTLNSPKPEITNISFEIKEGPKVFIKGIKFIGNTSISRRKLKKVLGTTKKGLFSWFTDSGVLKKDLLEQDSARLTSYYHNLGYIEAKVSEAQVVQEGEWLYITFNISEGTRYRVGTIDIQGDLIETEEALLELTNVRNEEYLSRKTLREDIMRISDFYSEKGYAYAEVSPAIDQKGDAKKVNIVLTINKGDLIHLDRITIQGNTRTRDKVIRRELEITEGGLFDSKALRASHANLKRLSFFEDIRITPQPTLEKDLMNVLVEVKEKPTGAFSIGAGYSSVDNMMFMGEVSQNNLLGKGQRLAFEASLSSRTNRYNISFTEPHLNDSKLLFGFDLYNWQREYDDYTKNSSGGALRFGYPVWELWNMGLSYGYDNADLTDVKTTASQVILDSIDIHITSFMSLAFYRDTRDMMIGARKGSRNSIKLKYAGGPLGGDSAFAKLEGSTSWFFPLPLDNTFHVKGAAGQVFDTSGGRLPVYEKFYLGGINTIRGFTHSHISPQDAITNERIGGKRMWYTNTEWLFPLAKEAGLRGVLFFDAGNVYESKWDLGQIKKSVGAGFRWLSPMGPLRLEWGYVIDPAPDEDQSNWDFSLGGAF